MIVGVCADKGAPGVSTLAVALGLVWPGQRVVLEADPSGGMAMFRMFRADTGEVLSLEPSVASLGAACRLGLPADGAVRYAQPTSLGVDVVPGLLTPERYAPMRNLWPQVGSELAAWRGTVIADLGRMQPGNAALPVARAATCVLLLGRATTEGLFGLRERAADLVHQLGDPTRERPSLAVVVTGPTSKRKPAVRSADEMLTAAGIPVPVLGFWAEDRAGAEGLWAGMLTRRVAGSDLVRSARSIAEGVIQRYPHLVGAPEPVDAATSREPAGRSRGEDDAADPASLAGSEGLRR